MHDLFRNGNFTIDLGCFVSPTAYTLRHARGYGRSALRNWLFQVWNKDHNTNIELFCRVLGTIMCGNFSLPILMTHRLENLDLLPPGLSNLEKVRNINDLTLVLWISRTISILPSFPERKEFIWADLLSVFIGIWNLWKSDGCSRWGIQNRRKGILKRFDEEEKVQEKKPLPSKMPIKLISARGSKKEEVDYKNYQEK